MRELQSSNDNTLTVTDRMGGGEVVLRYRTPTTAERINFTKSQTKRQGNKIISRIAEARLAGGLSILTGFRKGDFSFGGVEISSTPGEEGYRSDWKNLLYATASDLIMVLGEQIFEGEQQMPQNIEFVDGGEELAELPEISEIPAVPAGNAAPGAAVLQESQQASIGMEALVQGAEGAGPADLAAEAAKAEGPGEDVPLTSSQTSAT
jgi:hypothetical protein